MKTLKCREVGFDCDAVVQAATEEKVLEQAAAHAKAVHNVEVTPEMAKQIREKIKGEQ